MKARYVVAFTALCACADVTPDRYVPPGGGYDTNTTVGGSEGVDHGTPDPAPVPQPAGMPGYESLRREAERILDAAKSSEYTHTTYVDEATATFDFDCSGFLNYALARVAPDALATLRAHTLPRPVAQSYTLFYRTQAPAGRWHEVPRAKDLVPGDVIAWLEPSDVMSTNTGHVMVVAATPTPGADASLVNVTIIDSTETPHGATDARTVDHRTGVGEATIVLRVDPSGAPIGYRWTTDPASRDETTTVGLGHLD